jgi:hypothetical protein
VGAGGVRFRLIYEGPLKGNRRKAIEKDHLRNYFSDQLAEVWRDSKVLQALMKDSDLFRPREIGGRFFRPMIVEAAGLRCELDFLILSPKSAGSPLNNGDLDNRLKTLIDGLRQPSQSTEVTASILANSAEHPLCVLLEDDQLGSGLVLVS